MEESSIKENAYKSQLEALNEEKRRLDLERANLLREKNQENREWQSRYDRMQAEHEEVMRNLKDANRQYLAQVGENEDLKNQLKEMQQQHLQMMNKFAEFEERLINAQ